MLATGKVYFPSWGVAMKPVKQQGTALISALLITAIAALLATATLLSSRLLIHQADLTITGDQLYEYLLGANDWAQMVITTNTNLKKVKSLQINQGEIQITGKIYAQQGLFNINNLQEPRNESTFVRLLRAISPSTPIDKANALAKTVSDWINSESTNDDRYLQLHPPYRPAHRWLTVTSELRAVLGMDAKTYQALLPYITALPVMQNTLDINGVPRAIFFALSDTIDLSQAQHLLDCRDNHGFFNTMADFVKTCGPVQPALLSHLTTEEHYFLLRATATQGHQTLVLTSLLLKDMGIDGKQKVKIIWQQLNTDS